MPEEFQSLLAAATDKTRLVSLTAKQMAPSNLKASSALGA